MLMLMGVRCRRLTDRWRGDLEGQEARLEARQTGNTLETAGAVNVTKLLINQDGCYEDLYSMGEEERSLKVSKVIFCFSLLRRVSPMESIIRGCYARGYEVENKGIRNPPQYQPPHMINYPRRGDKLWRCALVLPRDFFCLAFIRSLLLSLYYDHG